MLILLVLFCAELCASAAGAEGKPAITLLDPPEKKFFSKVLDFHGIPIKAHKVVVNEALYGAYDRLSMALSNQPMVISNLAAAGAELHIIGRDQVTTTSRNGGMIKAKRSRNTTA